MPDFRRLDFIDGDFVMVEAPALLDCDRIRAYHLQLHKVLEGLPVWPPDLDEEFYPELKIYYQKIGDLMTPPINCDRLTSLSRHTFFVCTEPTKHPQSEQLLPGLSVLEQMMGYSYKNTGGSSDTEKTTGNPTLDILTSVLLIFKGGGLAIARKYSREDAMKMAVFANQLKTPSDDKEKDKVTLVEGESEPDHPVFIQNKAEIFKALTSLNINIPSDF